MVVTNTFSLYYIGPVFNFPEIQQGNERQAKRKDGKMNESERRDSRNWGEEKAE